MTLAVMMWMDFRDEAPYGLTYFAIGYMTNVISYLSLAFLLYDGNKYFVGFLAYSSNATLATLTVE